MKTLIGLIGLLFFGLSGMPAFGGSAPILEKEAEEKFIQYFEGEITTEEALSYLVGALDVGQSERNRKRSILTLKAKLKGYDTAIESLLENEEISFEQLKTFVNDFYEELNEWIQEFNQEVEDTLYGPLFQSVVGAGIGEAAGGVIFLGGIRTRAWGYGKQWTMVFVAMPFALGGVGGVLGYKRWEKQNDALVLIPEVLVTHRIDRYSTKELQQMKNQELVHAFLSEEVSEYEVARTLLNAQEGFPQRWDTFRQELTKQLEACNPCEEDGPVIEWLEMVMAKEIQKENEKAQHLIHLEENNSNEETTSVDWAFVSSVKNDAVIATYLIPNESIRQLGLLANTASQSSLLD